MENETANPDQSTPVAPAPKASREEKLKRLDRVRELLCRGLSDWQIKATVSEEFGIKRRSVEPYIAEVRRQLSAEFDPSKFDDIRNESLAFYKAKAADPKVADQAQIRARENHDALIGLNTKEIPIVQKVDVSLQGSIAKLAAAELTEEDLQKLIAAKQVVEEKRLGQSEDDDGEGE